MNVDGALNRATIGSMTDSELLAGLGFVGTGDAGKISVTGNITDSAVRVNAGLGSFSAGNVIDSALSAADEIRTLYG